MTTTAYTPLESLLLFQSLAAFGATDPISFNKTSELLKSNALVKDAPTFDPGRLSPDALREVYLQLLREELRAGSEQAEGYVSPSKKRKLQSPSQSPLNIKDTNDFSDRLPQLVEKLYAHYRDAIVKSIRDDERKYEQLQREIAEIERGEWDERILKDTNARANRGEPVSDRAKSLKRLDSPGKKTGEDEYGAESKDQVTSKPSPSPKASPRTASRPEGLAISDVLNNQDAAPGLSGSQPPPPIQNGAQGQPTPQSRTPSVDQGQGQRPSDWKWENSYSGPSIPGQPEQYPANTNYPPYGQQYPTYPPQGQPPYARPNALPPPHGHVPPHSPHSSTGYPILPPPNVGRPTSSQGHPLDALADIAGQQYRASQSPSLQQGPLPGYSQPYPSSPSFHPNSRSPTINGPPPQQWSQNYPAPYPTINNYNNYQQTPPGQRPFVPPANIAQTEQRPYSSPYNPSQGPKHLSENQKDSQNSTPKPRSRPASILPHTPASHGLIHSTGKATRWTPHASASTPKIPRSPKRPEPEPLSPILAPAKSIRRTPKQTPAKLEITSVSKVRGNGKRQRGRAGSTESPGIAESYRSQSVMSHGDELSLDNEGHLGRRVKAESATPRQLEDTGDTTADESTTRQRRGTLRGTSSPMRAPKRKRQDSIVREPSGPPTHVMWTRNFLKISSSALERITAHRNASTFAHPIKDRDAPGYKDVILRPQDLKSIKSAIVAGSKAGAAVAATMDDQGHASMKLPISEELVPPKGIVNNAQLEKELMRMFANAIMFNLDPDRGLGPGFELATAKAEGSGMEGYAFDENGVVTETRAMFADTDKIVGEMRSAEKIKRMGEPEAELEDEDVDELAGDEQVSKRRRRA